jgi:hypothetical protein
MDTPPANRQNLVLARLVRERFLAEVIKDFAHISTAVQERLSALLDEPTTAKISHMRRDVWEAYKGCRTVWLAGTTQVWKECMDPALAKKPQGAPAKGLELVGAEVVENKILASRTVVAVMDQVGGQFEDLRVRMRLLEGIDDLRGLDLLRPEVLVLMLVEQWAASGMPGESWPMVNEVVQRHLVDLLGAAYKNANGMLIKQNVLPTIELKDRVMPSSVRAANAARSGPPSVRADTIRDDTGNGQSVAPRASAETSSSGAPFWRQSSGAASGPGPGYGAGDETRMLTSVTPLARARNRAQGVVGQLRRMFASYGGGDMVGAPHQAPSGALAAALASPAARPAANGFINTIYEDFTPAGVLRVATDLRRQTVELKKAAETKGEKATIEIVALMFQAILVEERISPGIRVWFARLQMPVLRVALEDPEFLGTTTHPARLLIDRMGSCVMGFDASGVQANAMETEVKRIVQVIEQYPETGKKVYQVVFDEFQKFLSKFLTESGPAQKVVSVAQQVEQKETLTIQYTIEMRNTLKDLPVRDEIRSFLFKVWAEVLAVSAVGKGPQHADTLSYKTSATDLVWSASAKPNRVDRARVIQELPNLLLRLRSGMALLGMATAEQETHIKTVSDILADAFLSKTQAIAQDKIDQLGKRLGNLEDFVSEDGLGDLPLDAESIEMMLGIDASDIEVVANGGSKPTVAMLAWAQELQVGSWYTLDHNKQVSQVQFAWCSQRKHLNLFAASSGKSYLIQAGRLAAYLQAGLLLPQEEESLTVRATRDALMKLEANPERLLA